MIEKVAHEEPVSHEMISVLCNYPWEYSTAECFLSGLHRYQLKWGNHPIVLFGYTQARRRGDIADPGAACRVRVGLRI